MSEKTKTDYQVAVDGTQEFLSDGLRIWVERQKRIFVFELAYTVDTFVDEETGFARWTGHGVDHLIATSNNDPLSFDALNYIACELLKFGQPIPEPLVSFTTGVLCNEIKRPNKKARYCGANAWRDKIIFMAVIKNLNLGLNAVHDDSKNGISACGAVAEALQRMGEKPSSYRHVKAIWEKEKRPVPPLEQSLLDEIAVINSSDCDHHEKSKAISSLIKRSGR